MIKEPIGLEVGHKELKDPVIDAIVETCFKESNHIKESYTNVTWDINVLFEDEKLINFELVLEIKHQKDDDLYYFSAFNKAFGALVNFEITRDQILEDYA